MRYRLLILTIIFNSCTKIRQATCEETVDAYSPDNISMIITEPSKSVYDFSLKGISPVTGKETHFKSKNYTWALDFNEFISVGDTVYKRQGELKFYIHKKDTTLVFTFECQGKVYE